MKSSSLISFEQNLLDQKRVEKLKIQCPDLVGEAMDYYQRAIDDNQYGSSEDSLYYLKLAHITWTTAERRADQLNHRQRLGEVQQRYENAQRLLKFAISRRQELALLQTRQAQLIQRQSAQEKRQNQTENQELARQLKAVIESAREARAQAQAAEAPRFAPGLYKKGEMALRSAEETAKRGDLSNAIRIASGARDAFHESTRAAQPFLEKQRARVATQERMQQLIQDASQIPNAEANSEMRGVVVTLNKLYRGKRLTPSGRESVRQLAQLIRRYHDLRIIIEGHTRSMGRRQRKRALSMSQKMADEVKLIITQAVSERLKISALGRGDYAPISSNPKDARNQRIDVVFFKPRAR